MGKVAGGTGYRCVPCPSSRSRWCGTSGQRSRRTGEQRPVGQLVNRRRRAIVGLVSMVGGAVCLVATIPGQASADPPGNNGTVKIDDTPFDDHPDNEPHVGCVFQVDWYGFDKGGPVLDVSRSRCTRRRASRSDPHGQGVHRRGRQQRRGVRGRARRLQTYNLTDVLQGFQPHPQQGWHVKLTVNNDGSHGADVKHKVFWVSGCETPPTTSTSTTSTTEGPTTSSDRGSDDVDHRGSDDVDAPRSTTTSTTEAPTTSSDRDSTTTSTTEAPTTSTHRVADDVDDREADTTSHDRGSDHVDARRLRRRPRTEAPTTSSTEAPTTSSTEATSTTAVAPSSTTTSLAVSPVGELPKTGGGSQTLLIAAGIILLLGGGALLGSTKLGQEGLA